ncbi:hypothetical protein PR003_g20858, partial [Phytophthora rubi]
MRRRLVKERLAADVPGHLPEVAGSAALDERPSSHHSKGVAWAPAQAPTPKYLFTSPVAPPRGGLDTMRSLDLRDKKKLRCIWLAPDEGHNGDQQIVRPPPLDSMQYAQISASMFGHNVMEKIKRADNLSVQLERSDRFMDAMHTYEQSAKMLHRCIQKREEAPGVMMDELKWLRIDYEIRCVQLVALCMCGARKTAAGGDNTAFLLLKKAEELTARDGLQYCKKHIQRAAVYQNMANYYKKQKKYQAALQAAEKAVRINDKLALMDRFPIAYFLQACLHGLLQEPAKAGFVYTACLTVAEAQRPSQGGRLANESAQATEVFHTLKAATLHNLAIEWANLNMPDQTRDALASAMEVGVHYLPQTHPVVVRILETYKVMRENFLFHSNRVVTAPVAASPPSAARPSVPVRPTSPPPLENGGKRPLPPSSQKPQHEVPGDVTSPRTRRLSSREAHRPETEDIAPVPPPSRRPTSPNSASVVSPRARAVKRPTTTPEVPAGLSGQTLPPGATRTSHLWAVPDKIYGHSLGAKYNPYKERVLEEARTFGIRRRAAMRIQKSWRSALLRHRALKRKEQAATVMQCTFRMHQQKAHYERTLHRIRRTQAVWRGGLARSRKKMTLASIVQIQTAWRVRNERVKFAIKKIRLVLIQSVVRGFLARAAWTQMHNAATEIQAQVRRHLCEQKFNQNLSSAATINRVLRADLELRALNAAVESTLEHIVGIALTEPPANVAQPEEKASDIDSDLTDGASFSTEVLDGIDESSKNDEVGETEIAGALQINAMSKDAEQTTSEVIDGDMHRLEAIIGPATDSPSNDQHANTFPLLKSESDRAILGAMMGSTITNCVNAAIKGAIEDCSNDARHLPHNNSIASNLTTVNLDHEDQTNSINAVGLAAAGVEADSVAVDVDAVETVAVVAAVVGAVSAAAADVEAVAVAEPTMPVETAASSSVEPAVDAEVDAVMAAVLSAVSSAPEVEPVEHSVEAESVAVDVDAVETVAVVAAVVEAVSAAAADVAAVAVVEPTMPVETAASSSVEPAVDAEVDAVMAAVLSAMSSAPEVEPVEHSVEAESVAVDVDAVETVAVVAAVVEAVSAAAADVEAVVEPTLPVETAASSSVEPAVDAEVDAVMAAVLSAMSSSPEVEPVEHSVEAESVAVDVDAVETVAVVAAVVEAVSAAAADVAAVAVVEPTMPVETAASSSVEPAVDAEVDAVMAAVLSAVSSAPEVEPVEHSVEAESVAVDVDAVETVAVVAAVVEAVSAAAADVA